MTHDIRAKYEEERTRAQEQSQILYLQNQIDELRRQLKDTNNKYAWAMEQLRKNEALIAQVHGIVDRTAEENLQTLESFKRELTTLRKEIANALLKIEEGVKPIREIQTQVQHVAELRKRDHAQVSLWFSRIEALESSVPEFDVRIRESDERHKLLAVQLDKLHKADEEAILEIRKLHEELQMEKQALRRQAIEAQQMVAGTESTFQELHARINRHDELIQVVSNTVEALPEQIDLLGQQIPEIIAEIKRIERISTDRFLLSQERIEELRGQQDEKITDLRSNEQDHIHELHAWLERLDSWCREYEGKVHRTHSRVEALRNEYVERLQAIETREQRLLDTMLSALKQVVEQNRVERVTIESTER